MRLLAIFSLPFLLALPAAAGPWFTHEFGEKRSYHQDFLAVCADNGAGPCRAVQYLFDPANPSSFGKGFFGVARLAVHGSTNGPAVEFYMLALPDDPVGPFELILDGRTLDIPEASWSRVTPEGNNVAESVSILKGEAADVLVAGMKRGFFLTFKAPEAEAVFSLRGLTSALNAIEQLEQKESH